MEALPRSSTRGAGVEGLVIAVSNPKIALFFAALFSQFIQPDATALEKDPHREHRCWHRYALVCTGFDDACTNGRLIGTAAPRDLVESLVWRDTHLHWLLVW